MRTERGQQTADPGQRKFQIPNSKSQTPKKFKIQTWNLARQHESTKAREARSEAEPEVEMLQ